MLHTSCTRVRTFPNQKWSCPGSHFGKSLLPAAVSPCSVCSHPSAPAPCSPQPNLAPLDSSRQLSPADGHGGCRRNAGGIRLTCFISCCLGQFPTFCQFLGASNCCSLWGTDVVSSVASVQPPYTSAEENSAHSMELEFRLSRRHRFFFPPDHSQDRNVGMWHKIFSLSTSPVLLCSPFNLLAWNQDPPLKIG